MKNFGRSFKVVAISANLPKRCHMVDFLVNLALNLRPRTNQKLCQEAFKISKNGIENLMQVSLAFGALLARILVDFAAKLGGKLEPSWPILAVLSCLILPYLTKSWVVPVGLVLPWLSWVSWPQRSCRVPTSGANRSP